MYKGVIKKSRSLDVTALSQFVDVLAPIYIMLQPEDIGISVVAYAAIRVLLNYAQMRLRFLTTGPVGEK